MPSYNMNGGGMLSNLKGIFCNRIKSWLGEMEIYSSLLKISKFKSGEKPNPSRSSLHSERSESADWYEVVDWNSDWIRETSCLKKLSMKIMVKE